MVLSYKAIRRAVGVLGVLLPFMLLVGTITSESSLLPSISSFYYAPRPLNGLFTGVLCTIGVFLIAYKGYKREDDEYLSDDQVACMVGTGAIFIGIFPIREDCAFYSYMLCADTLSALMHYFGVLMFFGFSVIMLRYKFTRSYDERGKGALCKCKRKCKCNERKKCNVCKCEACERNQKRKKFRDRVYRFSAGVIFYCILLLILLSLLTLTKSLESESLVLRLKDSYSLIFWVEAVAVWAFGVAWFIKGEKDFYKCKNCKCKNCKCKNCKCKNCKCKNANKCDKQDKSAKLTNDWAAGGSPAEEKD